MDVAIWLFDTIILLENAIVNDKENPSNSKIKPKVTWIRRNRSRANDTELERVDLNKFDGVVERIPRIRLIQIEIESTNVWLFRKIRMKPDPKGGLFGVISDTALFIRGKRLSECGYIFTYRRASTTVIFRWSFRFQVRGIWMRNEGNGFFHL